MKRDPRLHGLSTHHHHALVLARDLDTRARSGGVDAHVVADLRTRFDATLFPHFAIEEELLLPALRRTGEDALVERTLRDHAALREHLAAAERGELDRVAAFAALLAEHVRFEERELFPGCEERVDPSVLDEVERRTRAMGS